MFGTLLIIWGLVKEGILNKQANPDPTRAVFVYPTMLIALVCAFLSVKYDVKRVMRGTPARPIAKPMQRSSKNKLNWVYWYWCFLPHANSTPLHHCQASSFNCLCALWYGFIYSRNLIKHLVQFHAVVTGNLIACGEFMWRNIEKHENAAVNFELSYICFFFIFLLHGQRKQYEMFMLFYGSGKFTVLFH